MGLTAREAYETRGVGLVNNIRRAVAILALALYFCAY